MPEPVGAEKAPVAIEISIQRLRCKRCGYCVEFCPKDVFDSEGGRPVVARGERCTGCGLCEALCPEFAIKVARKAPEAHESEATG
ncbi:MAG: 4Fe-4S dicluster domain-containing protein [Planctomycetota bacterium]